MGVEVDEPRRERQPAGVDLLCTAARDPADGRDPAAVDGEIPPDGITSRAVDDPGVANDEVGHCGHFYREGPPPGKPLADPSLSGSRGSRS